MEKELKFLLYATPREDVKIDVALKDETIWLTQKAMAALFGVQVPAINKHLRNIFEEGELDEKVVVSILEITTQHGAITGKTQHKDTQIYSLDAIISVGYRINSVKATEEYDEFNKTQKIISDFDKHIVKLSRDIKS